MLAAAVVIAIWIVVLHRGHSFCCSSKRYSASWFVLVGLYALVCTLNMVMGTLIVRNRLSRLLGNYEISQSHLAKKIRQLYTLVWGNFAVAYALLVWILLAHEVISNTHVTCSDYFWRPNDNFSGLFQFAWSVFILVPAFLFWLTFYHFRTG